MLHFIFKKTNGKIESFCQLYYDSTCIAYDFLRQPTPSCKKLMANAYKSVLEHLVKNIPKSLYMKKLNGGFNQKGFAVSTLTKMLAEAVSTKCSKQRELMVDCIKDHCAVLRLKEVRKEQLELLKVDFQLILDFSPPVRFS